jgi:hypothetical protein
MGLETGRAQESRTSDARPDAPPDGRNRATGLAKFRVCESQRTLSRDPSHLKLESYACTFAVLFEDLRIELLALIQWELPLLDVSSQRTTYFLRRSIATLKEFAHAITELDRRNEFHSIKAQFSRNEAHNWKRAVEFFYRYGASHQQH